MTKPLLICIGGSGPKSGKSTAARALTGYTIVRFADPLKDLVADLYGITRDELEAQKDAPLPITIGGRGLAIIAQHVGQRVPIEGLFGVAFPTVRALLQQIGTQVIRKLDPDWHVRKLQERLVPGVAYVADDCRFKNELDLIMGLGGQSIFINRPDMEADDHESENSLQASDFMRVIENDGSVADLENKMRALIEPVETVTT